MSARNIPVTQTVTMLHLKGHLHSSPSPSPSDDALRVVGQSGVTIPAPTRGGRLCSPPRPGKRVIVHSSASTQPMQSTTSTSCSVTPKSDGAPYHYRVVSEFPIDFTGYGERMTAALIPHENVLQEMEQERDLFREEELSNLLQKERGTNQHLTAELRKEQELRIDAQEAAGRAIDSAAAACTRVQEMQALFRDMERALQEKAPPPVICPCTEEEWNDLQARFQYAEAKLNDKKAETVQMQILIEKAKKQHEDEATELRNEIDRLNAELINLMQELMKYSGKSRKSKVFRDGLGEHALLEEPVAQTDTPRSHTPPDRGASAIVSVGASMSSIGPSSLKKADSPKGVNRARFAHQNQTSLDDAFGSLGLGGRRVSASSTGELPVGHPPGFPATTPNGDDFDVIPRLSSQEESAMWRPA